jgi:hypothetical protein
MTLAVDAAPVTGCIGAMVEDDRKQVLAAPGDGGKRLDVEACGKMQRHRSLALGTCEVGDVWRRGGGAATTTWKTAQ